MSEADSAAARWDEDRDAYVARFDGTNRSPSVAVAETLTETVEVGDRPLFDYVDPDALDALVAGSSPSTTVTFDVEDAAVTVHGDGRILVRPP
ncbi:HalOD1 output domain-containing protein [Haloplanus halophilus]|uniref:HalOD1 output domain-containing protein n=1 Tax=Haloplanus halophilus TaxID=2949993 RepID=UPI00203B3596|nr:HalOD1 output domain-containing protein [Haloplanus sp. GDY1]